MAKPTIKKYKVVLNPKFNGNVRTETTAHGTSIMVNQRGDLLIVSGASAEYSNTKANAVFRSGSWVCAEVVEPGVHNE